MYLVKKISLDEAEKIWRESPNSCIYNSPKFLKNFKNIHFYCTFKGLDPMMCWPIFLNDKKEIDIPDFFYYFGPYWSNKILLKQEHSNFSTTQEVYNSFIKFFTQKYKKINFELNYSFQDIRAFDWWNYNNKKKKFKIYPRYTAIINNLNNKTEEDLLKSYRYVRRYEIKKFNSIQEKIKIKNKISFSDLNNLYFNTIPKIKNKIQKKKMTQMIELIYQCATNGFGNIIAYADKKSNEIASIILILYDNNSSHLVFNLASEEWKKKGIMSWCMHKAIVDARKNKKNTFDFNGANSPHRGDNKHSFGSKSALYFKLNY